MATLCRPSVSVPEHVITMEETLELARRCHTDHPQLPLTLRLIENTGVRTRHIVQPIEDTLEHPGFEDRNKVYEREAKSRVPAVIQRALDDAELLATDIDVIIYVSCTGFMMPSLTAWLINEMGFDSTTRQIPIAQLGCAAGGAAINRAHDFCTAYPEANALIVACEFCSLCYQPTDLGVGSLLCNGLFGDGIAAAVVRGRGGTGVRLERNGSYLIPKTEDWIMYDVKATGFHFLLDKRVPATMEPLAPALKELAESTVGTPPTWTSTSCTRAAPGSSTISARFWRSTRTRSASAGPRSPSTATSPAPSSWTRCAGSSTKAASRRGHVGCWPASVPASPRRCRWAAGRRRTCGGAYGRT